MKLANTCIISAKREDGHMATGRTSGRNRVQISHPGLAPKQPESSCSWVGCPEGISHPNLAEGIFPPEIFPAVLLFRHHLHMELTSGVPAG